MRTTLRIATLVATGGLVLAACGSDSSSDSVTRPSSTVAGAATTAKPSATTAGGSATTTKSSATTAGGSATTKSSATTAAGSATTATSSTAAGSATTKPSSAGASETTLKVGTSSLGSYLVDGAGQTLYIFTKDSKGQPSTCVDACATTWPPVLAAASTPTAGSGVESAEITEIARADGTKQIAYYGMPLYRYAKDTSPGQTAGEGVNSVWYVVNPEGSAIK